MADITSLDAFLNASEPNRVEVPICTKRQLAADAEAAEESVEQALASVRGAEQRLELIRENHEDLAGSDQLRQARTDLETAQKELRDAEEKFEQARQAAEAHQVTFVLQSIGAKPWADLVASHPPRKEQVKQWRDNGQMILDHDPDTLRPAAVAACLVEPFTVDQAGAERLATSVNQTEWLQLVGACFEANGSVRSVPKSRKPSGAPPRSAKKSGPQST